MLSVWLISNIVINGLEFSIFDIQILYLMLCLWLWWWWHQFSLLNLFLLWRRRFHKRFIDLLQWCAFSWLLWRIWYIVRIIIIQRILHYYRKKCLDKEKQWLSVPLNDTDETLDLSFSSSVFSTPVHNVSTTYSQPASTSTTAPRNEDSLSLSVNSDSSSTTTSLDTSDDSNTARTPSSSSNTVPKDCKKSLDDDSTDKEDREYYSSLESTFEDVVMYFQNVSIEHLKKIIDKKVQQTLLMCKMQV